MIGTLNRVIVFVDDVPKCTTFYRNVLGLTPSGYADEGWVPFDAGGCAIALHKATPGKRPSKGTRIDALVASLVVHVSQIISNDSPARTVFEGAATDARRSSHRLSATLAGLHFLAFAILMLARAAELWA
jgi:catechol 2,3-dioxygenase-like lactoylglutathione lyase family enzyme